MRSRQRGVALLIIALILGLATVGFFFSKFSARNIEQERAAETTAALAEAKALLLGFALSFEASNPGRYAFLPCPETSYTFDAEGSATGSCGSQHANRLGRLPWRSLRSAPLRDGDKECLWYAVSSAYKNSQTASNGNTMLNADSPGQFRIVAEDGTVLAGAMPETRAVAVIFSAGSIRSSQDRSQAIGLERCRGNYMPINYLDNSNGISNATVQNTNDHIDTFVVANKSQDFNDHLVFITQDEIFGKLITRNEFLESMDTLTRKIAECIASHPDGLPRAAPVGLPDYRKNTNYESDASLFKGRVPYQIDNSGATVIIKTGCGSLNAADVALWKNWKDHFFYARAPNIACTSPGDCLTVNSGVNNYIGIVFFAGSKLGLQTRLAPPLDPDDTKMEVTNYLEGRNASNFVDGRLNYESHPSSSVSFNDHLFCIGAAPQFPVSVC